MPLYAWRCPVCSATVRCDPRAWPSLEEAHKQLHRVESSLSSRLDVLTRRVRELELDPARSNLGVVQQ